MAGGYVNRSAGSASGATPNQAPRVPGYSGLSQPPMEMNSGGGWETQQAPAGYTWEPVQGKYVHSPTQQGQAVSDYTKAATGSLAGLLQGFTNNGSSGGQGQLSGGFGAGGPSTTGGGYGGGTGSPSGGSGGGVVGAGGHLPTLTLGDQTASNAASFAKARDTVGKTGRASLDALRGELGATGNLGSGAEVQGVKDVIQSGAGELGQVSRDQAVKNADLAADVAKTNYQGGITQRGQDVSAQEAQARLAQEERIAASNRQLQLLQMALGGLSHAGGGLVY